MKLSLQNKFKIPVRFNKPSVYALLLIVLFSLSVGFNLWGQGIDAVYSYSKGYKYFAGRTYEIFGNIISTIHFNNILLFPFLGTLITAFCLYRYFRDACSHSYSLYFSACLVLSWPLFLGLTNALRQGLTLVLFILMFSFCFSAKPPFRPSFILTLFGTLAFLSHTSGKILACFLFIYLVLKHFLPSAFEKRWPLIFIPPCMALAIFLPDFRAKLSHYELSGTFSTGLRIEIFSIILCTFIFGACIQYFRYFSSCDYFIIFISLCFCFVTVPVLSNSLLAERLLWIPTFSALLLFPRLLQRVLFANQYYIGSLLTYTASSVLSLAYIGFKFYN